MKPPDAPGFFGSLRSLAGTALGTVRDRVALFALEVEEERNRVFASFVWVCAAIFAAAMTLVFASLTVVYLFWESARLPVLVVLTLLYAGLLATAIVLLRRRWVGQPRPFAATLEELDADRAALRREP